MDLDACYQDFPKVIRKGGFNGYAKEGANGGSAERVLTDRGRVVQQACAWIGRKEADGSFREIIDIYNAHKPLPRGYAVKYTDAWCATFVSAVAIRCGVTKIIPLECGCGQMLILFKILGELVEDDAYRPKPGDVIFYDWQDSGIGDNTGWPDHVGIVEKVEGDIITVIEGNKNDNVGRRTLQVNGRYIRAYGVPKYKDQAAGQAAPAGQGKPVVGRKTVDQVAREVVRGLWGNGSQRRQKLKQAGYDYVAVQKRVNQLMKQGSNGS